MAIDLMIFCCEDRCWTSISLQRLVSLCLPLLELEDFSQSKSHFVAHLAPYITPLFWRRVVEEKYVTLADRNPNIHKHGSLRKDYVAYGDHWLQFIFPGCLSHYSHPFANEISTALSSCGYIGISQITSNKQLIDEMKFHIYENMNLKLSLPWKIYQY